MHKEAGDFDKADKAYRRAHSLNSSDSDLLLSLGHLRKRQMRMDEAREFYILSAKSGNPEALREVASDLSAGHEIAVDPRHPEAENALRSMESGLSIKAAPGFEFREGQGAFHISGLDPQIRFELSSKARSAPAAMVEIGLRSRTTSYWTGGILFVDTGDGFKSYQCLAPRQVAGDRQGLRFFLAAPEMIKGLRWDPIEGGAIDLHLTYVRACPLPTVEQLLLEMGLDNATPLRGQISPFFAKRKLTEYDRTVMQPFLSVEADRAHAYGHWLHRYASPDAADYRKMLEMIGAMAWRPKFSFIMPVYNTPVHLLKEVMDAMLAQNYPDFEICVADDCSPNAAVQQVLENYARTDARVKYVRRSTNGHISMASNTAAKIATGDYIVLVDHDDLIPDYTLFVVASYLNRFPDAKILFSDEDKIDLNGHRFSPYFKSTYNQFLMFGHNMVSHLGIYSRLLFEDVGGFRRGLEGSQDYDLFLRCSEHVDAHQIVHIPHVLYHWRQVPGSTAVSADQKDYAIVAARDAINGHFDRCGIPFRSIEGHAAGNSAIMATSERDTSITIIIPTRNGTGLLEDCLQSIAKHSPRNIEILIADNDSDQAQDIAWLADAPGRFPNLNIRVIPAPGAFNFSSINNLAAAQAKGDIICFLNNDTEVLTSGWLERARSLLALDDVGIVGTRLLYPDQTVQHFGIVIGMADHAVAGGVHLFQHAREYGYFSKHRMIGEFSAVTAACLFIRRSDFHAIGGFEADLAVAYNDVDLCLRMRAQGRRILCDAGIELIHKESKSRGSDTSPGKAERLNSEAQWMRDRWGDLLSEDPYYSPNLSLERPDFALAYPPRQPWPWQSENRSRPNIASGSIVRAPRFFSAAQINDRGFLAVCSILKDEAINILEWIAYHRAVGVDKFYLYDNNSTDNVRSLLRNLISQGIVDLIPWPINPGQTQAYDDFADRHRHNWTWAAFIDLDEFINPFGHDSLPEWLDKFDNASAIALQWMNFGPSGHETPPPGLLIEAYTTRFNDMHAMHGHVKTIVRMADYLHAQGPHSFTVRGDVVDEYGEIVHETQNYAILPVREHKSICINHYYTRSRMEWHKKVERGMADHGSKSDAKRNPEWFEIYEREAIVSDRRILKFADATRRVLRELGLPSDPQWRQG